MTNDPAPTSTSAVLWRRYLKEKQGTRKTREFLANNVRNARWLIESIEQRKSTIMRVIRQVVDAQRDFFDKGPSFQAPADDPRRRSTRHRRRHVSRAVSEKWIQSPRGVYPSAASSPAHHQCRRRGHELGCVKESSSHINEEDKQNPLNDDEIVEKLKEQGIDLARRTVAKYRKILNISTARQRKAFLTRGGFHVCARRHHAGDHTSDSSDDGDEFVKWLLEHDVRAEWVDGEVVMMSDK